MAFSRQVMVADFDSVRQRELWVRLGEAEAERRLTAILRLACLLEGRLILTDAQLLDGIYFMTHGPDEVAALLGCDPWRIPLAVSVEASFSSLEESLQKKLADSTFEWSSESAVADLSGATRERAVERHARRRFEWVAAVKEGRLGQRHFTRFDWAVFQRHWKALVPGSSGEASAVGTGWSLEGLGLHGCTGRSVARDVLCERFGSLTDPAAESVYARWDAAYQSALAESNDASWMHFFHNPTAGAGSRPGVLRLDGTLLDDFAEIDGTVYAVASHRARDAVKRWRHSPSENAAHEISYAVTEALAPTTPRKQVFSGALFRFLTPLVLACAVFLMTLDKSHAARWATLVALLGFFAAIPWAELFTTIHARQGRLQAVIRVEPQ